MEFNFSLREILFLRDRYSYVGSSKDLQAKVVARVTKKVRLPDLIDGDPLDNIINSLNTVGCCFISLFDSNIKEHYFSIFKTPEGIFRLESYSGVYSPRIVEWSTYKKDMKYLVVIDSGAPRTFYWNGLFNARETSESNHSIAVEVNFIIFQ